MKSGDLGRQVRNSAPRQRVAVDMQAVLLRRDPGALPTFGAVTER